MSGNPTASGWGIKNIIMPFNNSEKKESRN
jgi:hypothetical protein